MTTGRAYILSEHAQQTPLEQFPASAQPVSVADLKPMLILLRDSLHIDMTNML